MKNFGETPPTEEREIKKRCYFSSFALTHISEMRILQKGGVLGKVAKEEGWRNISEHCLMEAVGADILAEGLGADRKKIVQAALLHDWYKRREVEAMRKEGGASGYESTAKEDTRLLRESGIPDDVIRLSHANIPESGDEDYLRERPLEVKIMDFIDRILEGSNFVEYSDRLQNTEKKKAMIEMSESFRARLGGKSLFEVLWESCALEQEEFEKKLGIPSGTLVQFIQEKLESRIQEA